MLEHVEYVYLFIESSILCLKQGGLLIYSVPSSDSFVFSIKNNILNMPPHHVTWWTNKGLAAIGDLFNLQMVDIHNEKLQPIHYTLYLSALFLQGLEETMGFSKQNKILDLSLRYKALKKVSSLISKFFVKGLYNPKFLPNGHSVTAIFQKN